jgi:hypothetical protein
MEQRGEREERKCVMRVHGEKRNGRSATVRRN